MRSLFSENLIIADHDSISLRKSSWEKFMQFFEKNFITGAFPNMFHILLFIAVLLIFSVDTHGPSIILHAPH